MWSRAKKVRPGVTVLLAVCAWSIPPPSVLAQAATRTLPPQLVPETPFTVSITIGVPAAGSLLLEDAPPDGWSEPFNISSNGVWDPVQGKVKWGFLFYSGSPAEVSYEVTPPAEVVGELYCFTGTVYVNGPGQPIEGDQCIGLDCQPNGIPDVCDVDCGAPSGECDVPGCGGSTDDNGNGVPDECECVDDWECSSDNNVCTYDHCDVVCVHTPNRYGDLDHSGAITVFDIFCILNGFGGQFPDCSFEDCDITGASNEPEDCPPNGLINVFDLFAVLNAFGGDDPCCSP